MFNAFQIIDISQPISPATACFPGDIPFSREVTVDYSVSQVINLCAFTMSPHVGTHADAPIHIHGDMNPIESDPSASQPETIGQAPLGPYIGPAMVIDVSPCKTAITWAMVEAQLAQLPSFPQRILFKTTIHLRYDVFEPEYAWLSVDLIHKLAERGVVLVGLDTPSVDAVDSKSLETHHALLDHGLYWLENLDLSLVNITPDQQPLSYFLVALPLKLMTLEASPVRAVLLKP